MRGFAAMVRVTLRQLAGGKRIIVFLALAALPAVVMWFASADKVAGRVMELFHEVPVGILLFLVVPVTALILGSGALGDERRDHTLSFLVLRPRPRWVIAAAKLTAAWVACTAVTATSALLAAAVVGIRIGDWSLMGPTTASVAIAALGYCAAFMVLGQVTGRAVLLGLLYVFVWEGGIANAAASLANVSLSRIGLSAYLGLVPDGRAQLAEALGAVAPGAGGAAAKAAVVAVVATLAAGSLLRRRDAA